VRKRTRRWLVALVVVGALVWLTEWQLNQALGPAVPNSSPKFITWWTANGASLEEFQESYGLFLHDLANRQDVSAAHLLYSVGSDVNDLTTSDCPDPVVLAAFQKLGGQVTRLQATLTRSPPVLATRAAVVAYVDENLPAIGQVSSTTQNALGVTVPGLDLTSGL
jgi:hypothetical protein